MLHALQAVADVYRRLMTDAACKAATAGNNVSTAVFAAVLIP